MTEMIDRVAKRLWDFDQENGRKQFSNHVIFGTQWDNKAVPWEVATGPDVVDFEANQYRDRARAAIEAMREPTEAMANEGAYLVPGDESTWRNDPAATYARQIWSEMIDAALTGDTK